MLKNLLNKVIVILVLFFVPSSSYGQSKYAQDDILGEWYVADNIAITTFYRSGNKYHGVTTWLREPNDANGNPKLDKNNPDKAKQTKPLLGAVICSDFVYEDEGVWTDGTIYDARSGKTYNCKITMKDKNTISVRGYVGFSLIGASTVWKRKI